MILNDSQIRQLAEDFQMIEPFYQNQIRQVELSECNPAKAALAGIFPRKLISFGLSSYGYDIRLSPNDFRVFRHIPGTIVNPKDFSPENLEPVSLKHDAFGDYFIIPAHSYGLGVAMEKLNMPRDVTAICMGKSTYARCFTGDTKVKLVDGDFTFLELIDRQQRGDRLYGYGAKNGKIFVQELFQPRYIEDAETVSVELDNGELIECTPDHKFLTRSGIYVEAQHLTPGQSLYPIYNCHSHGYPAIFDSVLADNLNSRTKAMKVVHRMVAESQFNGTDGLHVHHKDGDILNNHPSNLELLSPSEHAQRHNQEDQRHISGGLKFKELYNEDPKFRDHINSGLHSKDSKLKALEGRLSYIHSEANREKLKNARNTRWADPVQRLKQSEVAKNGCGARKRRGDITSQTLTSALLEAGTLRGAARILNVDRSAFRRFPKIISNFKNGKLAHNHKVVAVHQKKTVKPTYCLTAPESNNFALASGVFVHNCGIIANVTPAEAGWIGNLTLEISNSSRADCRVYAGEGICQLLFFKGAPCDVSYSDRAGKYQGQREQITLAKV